MHIEANSRSFAKALSYRLLATFATAAGVWWITGSLPLAGLLGGFDAVGKVLLYYAHERLWAGIRVGRERPMASVIWLTGFSGSGKTTIANALCAALSKRGMRVEHIDGDGVRQLFPGTGFSRADRDANVRRVAHLASLLERHGVTVVVSLISPFAESRAFARQLCGRFVEVHVSTPLEVCERRDPKGLYRRARMGDIKEFTGIDSPYEEPQHPEMRIDTSAVSVEEAVSIVLDGVTGSPWRR